MSIEDIVRRLKEDRQIAERERIQARIEAAFAAARNVERRRYAKPGELNPALIGRRKDDPPRPQLAQLAQPIMQQIRATGMSAAQPQGRKDGAVMWDIGEAPEVSDADLPKLLESCEVALGLKKQMTPTRPQTWLEEEPEKQPIWKRKLF